jgi:hypothetical protein
MVVAVCMCARTCFPHAKCVFAAFCTSSPREFLVLPKVSTSSSFSSRMGMRECKRGKSGLVGEHQEQVLVSANRPSMAVRDTIGAASLYEGEGNSAKSEWREGKRSRNGNDAGRECQKCVRGRAKVPSMGITQAGSAKSARG